MANYPGDCLLDIRGHESRPGAERSSVVMNHRNHPRIDLIPGTFPLAHHVITDGKTETKPDSGHAHGAESDKSNVSENVNRRGTGTWTNEMRDVGYL